MRIPNTRCGYGGSGFDQDYERLELTWLHNAVAISGCRACCFVIGFLIHNTIQSTSSSSGGDGGSSFFFVHLLYLLVLLLHLHDSRAGNRHQYSNISFDTKKMRWRIIMMFRMPIWMMVMMNEVERTMIATQTRQNEAYVPNSSKQRYCNSVCLDDFGKNVESCRASLVWW